MSIFALFLFAATPRIEDEPQTTPETLLPAQEPRLSRREEIRRKILERTPRESIEIFQAEADTRHKEAIETHLL